MEAGLAPWEVGQGLSGEKRRMRKWEVSRQHQTKSFWETHLWSDGFSRDSGLKGAREKVDGMQCKRDRPGGKKERRGGKEEGCCESTGWLTEVCFRPGAAKSTTYLLYHKYRPHQQSITAVWSREVCSLVQITPLPQKEVLKGSSEIKIDD